MKIGCHLSSAGGFRGLARDAVAVGADVFQFFTRNPRGGAAKPVDPADVAGFEPLIKKHRGRLSLRTDKQPTLVYQIPKRLGERDNSMDLVKEILGDIEAFLLPQAATPHR